MTTKALLFGAIGVLVETSELQRQAYNQAFAEAGLDWDWDERTYRDLLKKPGGQNRIQEYAKQMDTFTNAWQLHTRKSEIFQERLSRGVPLRPGIIHVANAARAAGWQLGLVTTTSADNVSAVLAATKGSLERSNFDFIGDASMASNPKPAPDIYRRALTELGVTAQDAIAIEDTAASAKAPLAAGIRTLGYKGEYATDPFPIEVEELRRLSPTSIGLAGPSGQATHIAS